ncbi:MAG: transcription-repair coupling factor, partial [Clostridia bacterium]|nr:transcription-repair coupling factor [Clostridia bacterium]
MSFLRKALKTVREYCDVFNAVKQQKTPVCITNLSRIHTANIIDTLPADIFQRALVVVADESQAEQLKEDLDAFGRQAEIFYSRDICFRKFDGVSREFERKRVGVLAKVLEEKIDIIIAPIDAAMSYTIPKDVLKSVLINLKAGLEISIDELSEKLIYGGYNRVEMIEAEGQFATRGGIFDI